MLDLGRKLFARIHRQKHHAHANHEVHFMARELDDWLAQGIDAMLDGSYTPRYLKAIIFKMKWLINCICLIEFFNIFYSNN